MKAYAIKDPKGNIITYTIRLDSLYCKTEFSDSEQSRWIDLYTDGYRCVPVLITEVKTDK